MTAARKKTSFSQNVGAGMRLFISALGQDLFGVNIINPFATLHSQVLPAFNVFSGVFMTLCTWVQMESSIRREKVRREMELKHDHRCTITYRELLPWKWGVEESGKVD